MAENGSSIRLQVTRGELTSEVQFDALSVDEASLKLAKELQGSPSVWKKHLQGVLEAAVSGRNAKVKSANKPDPLLFLGAIITSLVAFSALAAFSALSRTRHQHHRP